jgi:L-ascorbate metabolism protein UlaG (beta-lactamase superfamily)
MTITKYEHACMLLEEQEKQLLIDPGSFTKSLESLPNLAAIIVTHAHFDHLDKDRVMELSKASKAPVFSTAEVAEQLKGADVTVVEPGKEYQVGPFQMVFYGQDHAPIHESVDIGQNVGVFINDTLYYPGDSFEIPDKAVKVLATPISGPWMKTGEAMDFVEKIKPQVIIPVHDALHSDTGHMVSDNYLKEAAKKLNATYQRLSPAETLII